MGLLQEPYLKNGKECGLLDGRWFLIGELRKGDSYFRWEGFRFTGVANQERGNGGKCGG